nr:hypothetical protein [Tanacetum cinerariifolium]
MGDHHKPDNTRCDCGGCTVVRAPPRWWFGDGQLLFNSKSRPSQPLIKYFSATAAATAGKATAVAVAPAVVAGVSGVAMVKVAAGWSSDEWRWCSNGVGCRRAAVVEMVTGGSKGVSGVACRRLNRSGRWGVFWSSPEKFPPAAAGWWVTEESSKRAGEELESNKSKKKKLDEKVEVEKDNDQEEVEMKMYMRIIFDDEIALDAIPLATKPPIIVDWKIIKEGKINSYHIIRHDGSSKRFTSMIQML